MSDETEQQAVLTGEIVNLLFQDFSAVAICRLLRFSFERFVELFEKFTEQLERDGVR